MPSEAAERLKQWGANRLSPAQQRAVLWQFLAQFRNPLVLVLVLFTLLVNVALCRSLRESFLFAVALAVGLTPERLPMVRLKVIVKRPSAIQDMGTMDVLCTDKTGTLTEAKMKLERHVDATGQDNPQVLALAYLNSYFESGLKSPLDDAILAHENMDVSGWTKIDEVPFDFDRRRVSVLGIAWRDVAIDHPHAVVSDESELAFAGFAAFLDPPKASAGEALNWATASTTHPRFIPPTWGFPWRSGWTWPNKLPP